jgi:hypothetical protein
MDVQLTTQPDVFKWGPTKLDLFSVKTMHIDYMDDHTKHLHKYHWKIKFPPKIRVLMWFLYKKVMLTQDNLIKRQWQGNEKWCFCDQKETVQHLSIQCPIAKIVWRLVHMAFSIIPPKNIKNLFGNFLAGVLKKEKAHIRVGACAFL